MSSLMKKLKPASPSSSSSTTKKRTVTFYHKVTVRELPEHEAFLAEDTRRGEWEPAPDHDELWDGHNGVFWEEEKTLDEVKRIVVVRGMRATLSFQIGFGFFATIANFRRRRRPLPLRVGEEEFVEPKFGGDSALEEQAIRKEVRELFAASVQGLDFEDLLEDRETFDKLYAASLPPPSTSTAEASLRFTEQHLVDEVLLCEEVCEILRVEFKTAKQQMPRPSRQASLQRRLSVSRSARRGSLLLEQDSSSSSVLARQSRASSRSVVAMDDASGDAPVMDSLDLGHISAKRVSADTRRASTSDQQQPRMKAVQEEGEIDLAPPAAAGKKTSAQPAAVAVVAVVAALVLVLVVVGWRRVLVLAVLAAVLAIALTILLPRSKSAIKQA